MTKLKLITLLVGASLSTSAVAKMIKGSIVNEQNQPITNAKIHVQQANKHVLTDDKGQFNIELANGEYELHITAPRYMHKNYLVNTAKIERKLVFTLATTPFEVIDVTASPLHSSNIESAQPSSVLSGDALRLKQENSLGDTLKHEIGVHSRFHAGVASSPIIRGMDGARVLITQNGLDAGDASRVGPDHNVSSDVASAERIEILRGPATLFYGSGAIGGVVNVVDNRVPTSNDTLLNWQVEHKDNNQQSLASFAGQTGSEDFAVYADGFLRDADDYQVPEEHGEKYIENSQNESNGFTLGGSWLLDNQSYVGVSHQVLNQEYGIPGHSHGDEAVAVFADMKQQRTQILSSINIDSNWLKSINSQYAYTDYVHHEVEQGLVGTEFSNNSHEARIELVHQQWFDWKGMLSVHYKGSEFAAVGEEAFTPPSDSQSIALAMVEERHFDNVLVQLGARIEQVNIDANNVLLPQVHFNQQAEEDHHHHHDENVTRQFDVSHEFTPMSLSAGLVWEFSEGYNIGLSSSYSQRAPASAELFSFGPHIGTGSYETGALFKLDADQAVLTDAQIELETAKHSEVTLRKFHGDFGFMLTGFYSQIDDFYYQSLSGLEIEFEHGHDHDDHSAGHDDHEPHALPVYSVSQQDVVFHGFEGQAVWQVTPQFKASLQGDVITARTRNGESLSRTPAPRIAALLNYQGEQVSAGFDVFHYFEQNKVAALETTSDSYTLVDANVTYHMQLQQHTLALYLKANNLTDEYAQVHTSFLKHFAPLPGRSFSLGIRGQF